MAILRCRTLIRAGQNKNKIKETQKFWMNQIIFFLEYCGCYSQKKKADISFTGKNIFFFEQNTFITIADLNFY